LKGGTVTPQRFALYARRSRKEELAPGEQETSTSRQVTDCRKYAALRGWTIPDKHIYTESGVSAYMEVKRGAFDDMVAALERGDVDGVLFWKIDRAVRNTSDLARLVKLHEQRNILLASATEGIDTSSPMGSMLFELMGSIAKLESKNTSVRMRQLKEELARVGKPSGGGRRRFGFEDDQVTHRTDEAGLIREAARRVLSGEGTNTVCKDWNRRGLRMPGGSLWQATPLRRILTSPRVAGLRQHRVCRLQERKGEHRHNDDCIRLVGQATWKPILDRPTWDRLRVVLTDPSRRRGGRPTEWLLSGIARCGGKCKGGLYGRRNAKDGRPVYVDKGLLGGCNGIKIDGKGLEEFVVKATIDWLAGPGLEQARRELAAHDVDTEALSAQLRQDEQQLADLAELYGREVISLPEWLKAREPIERRITTVRKRLAQVPKLAALDGLPATKRALQRAWKRMPTSQRRAILRAVIDRLIVGPATPGRTTFEPDRVTLVFRDRERPRSRFGWRVDHDATARDRLKRVSNRLPTESDAGVLDTVAKAMKEK
jgi:site-specific DNA recombinase